MWCHEDCTEKQAAIAPSVEFAEMPKTNPLRRSTSLNYPKTECPASPPRKKRRRMALRTRPLDELTDNPELNIMSRIHFSEQSSDAKVENKIAIIGKLVESHWLFDGISNSLKVKLFKEFQHVSYKRDDVIFNKGDQLTTFMLIESGECDDSSAGRLHATTGTFGDINLIHKESVAEFTVKCITDVTLWTIEGGVYQFICKKHGQEQ